MIALAVALPVLAASDQLPGDGSTADNARLLPDVYPTDPVLPSSAGLREPYDPLFDIDWSLGLRGVYTNSTSGERFDTRLLPSISLEHIGTRSALNFDASAEIVRPSEGEPITLGALRLGLQTGYDLDSLTRFNSNGNLTLTQQTPGTPGLASNVSVAPQTISGGGDVSLTRQFGKFNVSVTGAAQRNVYGSTTLVDGSTVDNSDQNYWALDSGLRVGFQATPIFEVFGIAGAGRDIFDYRSATLGTSFDASDYVLKGGLKGRWSSTLEVTGSAGLGLRKFDVASLGDVVTQLYDAQLSYTPDPTLRLTAGFATRSRRPAPMAAARRRWTMRSMRRRPTRSIRGWRYGRWPTGTRRASRAAAMSRPGTAMVSALTTRSTRIPR